MTRPSKRGQVLAVVFLPEQEALELLKTAKIKIGWVVCRIRSYTVIKRCYKCLGFGHTTYTCKGVDKGSREGHASAATNADPANT